MSRRIRPGQLFPGTYEITSSFTAHAVAASSIQTGTDVALTVSPGTSSFLLTSASLQLFQITDTGVAIFATQSAELTGSAPVGGMYFTSSSFFVGLE